VNKKLLWILPVIALTISLFSINMSEVSADVYPAIYIDPATKVDSTLTPGKNYTVSIKTNYTGDDVWGYEFTLAYNPLVLQGVEVANGDLITTAKDPSATFTPGTFDNDFGILSNTGAGFEYPGTPMPVTSGPGTLANVTFTVVGIGDTYIELGTEATAPTRLIGYDAIMEEKYNIIDDVTPDVGHILHAYFDNFPPLYVAVHSTSRSTWDTTLGPGKNYTISIKTDYTGDDIWGYEFTLAYNPLVLQGVKVTNGDLITTAKNDSATFTPGTFDNDLGKLSLTGAGFEYPGTPMPVTSGPGTLANVTFTVVGIGDTYISLGPETKLIGYDAIMEEKYNIIDDVTPDVGHIQRGYFRNTEKFVKHNIAVTNAVLSVNQAYPKWTIQIYVTIKNLGTAAEKLDVGVYYDVIGPSWLVETKTISLGIAGSTTLTFNWPLIGFSRGDMPTLMVKATIAFGVRDPHPADNTFVNGQVKVKMPGDVDNDGDCDADDVFTYVSPSYGKKLGQPGFNKQCDFDGDDDCDADDVFTYLAPNYGKKYT